jgi:hypothetical protein
LICAALYDTSLHYLSLLTEVIEAGHKSLNIQIEPLCIIMGCSLAGTAKRCTRNMAKYSPFYILFVLYVYSMSGLEYFSLNTANKTYF